MAKKPGEMRPSEAAERLGVCYNTVINWVNAADDPTRAAKIPREAIRRDLTGHILIREEAISALASTCRE